jgi:hypothetical protein
MLKGGVEEILHKNHTSVVDENVDSAKHLEGRIGEPERLVNGSQISRKDMAVAPMLLNQLLRGLQADSVPTTDHQVSVGRGQRSGNLCPEAELRPCYQNTPSFKAIVGRGIRHEIGIGTGSIIQWYLP